MSIARHDPFKVAGVDLYSQGDIPWHVLALGLATTSTIFFHDPYEY
jgi:hypothetical protein